MNSKSLLLVDVLRMHHQDFRKFKNEKKPLDIGGKGSAFLKNPDQCCCVFNFFIIIIF